MAGFHPAVKSQARARIGLFGVGGSGKSMTALYLARGLVGPKGKIAVADTEGGSTQVYADLFSFDVGVVGKPYSPAKFANTIQLAVDGGYDLLIIDGISPWWEGQGGVLEIVDAAKASGRAGGGWDKGTPAQNAIQNAIATAPLHLIVTMRAKNEVVIEDGPRGKVPRKIGMKYVQRDSIEYELGFLFYADVADHSITTHKTRWSELDAMILHPDVSADVAPAEELGRKIGEWLNEGVALPPSPPSEEQGAPVLPPEAPKPADAPGEAPPPASGADLLDAAPAAGCSTAKLDTILAKVADLAAAKPETQWVDAIMPKVKQWYGVDDFTNLSDEQADLLVERLEQTLLRVTTTNAGAAA